MQGLPEKREKHINQKSRFRIFFKPHLNQNKMQNPKDEKFPTTVFSCYVQNSKTPPYRYDLWTTFSYVKFVSPTYSCKWRFQIDDETSLYADFSRQL